MSASKIPGVPRQAVILSAGLGTRLGDLTRDCPKVMVSIAGKPMLEHHVEWMRNAGVEEFFFNLHYLPESIVDFFGDGTRHGVVIRYSWEESLRGTAGALHGFREWLGDSFLVQYGDVFSRLDLARFSAFHRDNGAVATLAVHPSSHPEDSDIVALAESGRITALHHKPGHTDFGVIGNAGAYLLESQVLEYLSDPPVEEDFCRDVFPWMLEEGEKVFGYDTDDLLMDAGTPERLAWIEDFLKKEP